MDRVVIRDTQLEVRQRANGEWWVQGSPLEQLLPARDESAAEPTGEGLGPIEIIGEDIKLQFLQPGDERPKQFNISQVVVHRDNVRMAIDAEIDLPEKLGRSLTVSATQLLSGPAAERGWDISVEINDVELAGVSAMQPSEEVRFDSGTGDIELSLAYANKRVQSATAELDINDIAIAGLSDLAVTGRLEFLNDDRRLAHRRQRFPGDNAGGRMASVVTTTGNRYGQGRQDRDA